MDVVRDNFNNAYKEFTKAIGKCDFVSIDMEMTGLYVDKDTRPRCTDTLDERYQKLKQGVESFDVVQVGICLFTWIPDIAKENSADSIGDSGGYYEARPFNFNVFPCTGVNGIATEKYFGFMNTAFEFLSKNSFDFNKWVYQGIPYIRSGDAEQCRREKLKIIRNERPEIEVGEKDKELVAEIEAKLSQFLADNTMMSTRYQTENSFHRRLIYQIIARHKNLDARGRLGWIDVTKVSKKHAVQSRQRRTELLDRLIKEARGFSRVIDALSNSKKPVIGHNMPLDILHAFSKFYKPLPATRAEFESMLRRFLPSLIDTKYIIESTPGIKTKYGSSNLDEIAPKLEEEARPKFIRNHRLFTRNMTRNMHEAGYDAYLTGCMFINLLNLEGGLGSASSSDSQDASSELVLYRYINKLYASTTAGIFWDSSQSARTPAPDGSSVESMSTVAGSSEYAKLNSHSSTESNSCSSSNASINLDIDEELDMSLCIDSGVNADDEHGLASNSNSSSFDFSEW